MTLTERLTAALDELERLARAATPGPWFLPGDEPSIADFGWYMPNSPAGETEDSAKGRADAIYIATMSPDAALRWVRLGRGIVERHTPLLEPGQGYRKTSGGKWEYGYIDNPCPTCGTSDEYAVPSPCPDLRNLAAALGVEVEG